MKELEQRAYTSFTIAATLWALDDIDAAYGVLIQTIEQFPACGPAHNLLGFLLETQYGDPAQAEVHYQKCLELTPEDSICYHNYAVLLSHQGRFEELAKLLDQAATVPGINLAKIYAERALMYEMQFNFQGAIEQYQRALASTTTSTLKDHYQQCIAQCERNWEDFAEQLQANNMGEA